MGSYSTLLNLFLSIYLGILFYFWLFFVLSLMFPALVLDIVIILCWKSLNNINKERDVSLCLATPGGDRGLGPQWTRDRKSLNRPLHLAQSWSDDRHGRPWPASWPAQRTAGHRDNRHWRLVSLQGRWPGPDLCRCTDAHCHAWPGEIWFMHVTPW